jgi:hypothetical protein
VEFFIGIETSRTTRVMGITRVVDGVPERHRLFAGDRAFRLDMRWWLLLVLASCSSGLRPDREVARETVKPSQSPPLAAPHQSSVRLIAVTEAGDAALTVDGAFSVRLWPTLDGTREPVIVRAAAADQIALGRDPDGLYAAALDRVGGLELLRFADDGSVRSRVTVPAEPAFVELVAIPGGTLARRVDQTLVAFDGNGRARAKLAADSGEQIAMLVARGGVAFAALVDRDRPGSRTLRTIELAKLRWGRAVTLPESVTELELSPSGHRLGGITASTRTGILIELGARATAVASNLRIDLTVETGVDCVGFIDDDHLVLPDGSVAAWPNTRAASRLSVRTPLNAAFASDLVVESSGTGLQLMTLDRTRWLGYRDVGAGPLTSLPHGMAMTLGGRSRWLDDRLETTRSAPSGLAVDERHIALATPVDKAAWQAPPRYRVTLVDVVTERAIDLGTYVGLATMAYDPSSHVLVIPSPPATSRLQLDLTRNTATVLPVLSTLRATSVEPLDPKLAGGVVAVAATQDLDGLALETFRDTAQPTSRVAIENGKLLGVDRTGAAHVVADRRFEHGVESAIIVYRSGREVATVRHHVAAHFGAVNSDGAGYVLFDSHAVVALDRQGNERWRSPVWNGIAAQFTGDGRRVLVATGGGLVELDAATGKRLASKCGWEFGLHDTRPSEELLQGPLACAEPP